MTFNQYVLEVEKLIKEYTKGIPKETLAKVEDTIEESDVGCGKIWLEDYVDSEMRGVK